VIHPSSKPVVCPNSCDSNSSLCSQCAHEHHIQQPGALLCSRHGCHLQGVSVTSTSAARRHYNATSCTSCRPLQGLGADGRASEGLYKHDQHYWWLQAVGCASRRLGFIVDRCVACVSTLSGYQPGPLISIVRCAPGHGLVMQWKVLNVATVEPMHNHSKSEGHQMDFVACMMGEWLHNHLCTASSIPCHRYAASTVSCWHDYQGPPPAVTCLVQPTAPAAHWCGMVSAAMPACRWWVQLHCVDMWLP
jgi:hypothetical protein